MLPLILSAVSFTAVAACEEERGPGGSVQVGARASTSGAEGVNGVRTGVRASFEPGVCVIPHPEKAHKGGEDAYFVSDDRRALGVADGVGGWSRHGVDPALYSQALMVGARRASADAKLSGDPVKLMQQGYEAAKNIKGSSTCCIVVLGGEAHIKTANLGDSGFMVVRNGQPVFRSKEQQHSFNFPYQLGGLTSKSQDTPAHSDQETIQVKHNDLVILGTDGLWDNLYDEQILECVRLAQKAGDSPQKLATAIGQLASTHAHKVSGGSPFSDASAKVGRMRRYEGGKLDDITVLVGRVNLQGSVVESVGESEDSIVNGGVLKKLWAKL